MAAKELVFFLFVFVFLTQLFQLFFFFIPPLSEMNGEDIPRPYGYPVRCIVPGNAGARNCKYLERVNVTNEPCKGNCNWKQYAVHAPDVPMIKIGMFVCSSFFLSLF